MPSVRMVSWAFGHMKKVGAKAINTAVPPPLMVLHGQDCRAEGQVGRRVLLCRPLSFAHDTSSSPHRITES